MSNIEYRPELSLYEMQLTSGFRWQFDSTKALSDLLIELVDGYGEVKTARDERIEIKSGVLVCLDADPWINKSFQKGMIVGFTVIVAETILRYLNSQLPENVRTR